MKCATGRKKLNVASRGEQCFCPVQDRREVVEVMLIHSWQGLNRRLDLQGLAYPVVVDDFA